MSNSSTKDFFCSDSVSVHLETKLKDRVKILLLRKGMSQNKLADEVGVSIGTMSKIVNGGWMPTSQVMVKMGEVLECDSVILFGDSEYWKQWRKKMLYPKEDKK